MIATRAALCAAAALSALPARSAGTAAAPSAVTGTAALAEPAFADIELVDIPTAHAQAHRSFALNLRMYEGASVLTRLTVGLFDRLTLGLSWDVKNVLGSASVRGENYPQPYVKLTALREESGKRPAIALGYFLQGYGPHGPGVSPRGQFADDLGQGSARAEGYNLYFSKPRGFFLAATFETSRGVIVQWTAGINAVRLAPFRFEHDFGLFAGAAAGITEDLFVVLEYDDMTNRRGGNLNAGLNYHMGSGWRIELDVKNLFKPYSRHLRVPSATDDARGSRMLKLDVLQAF